MGNFLFPGPGAIRDSHRVSGAAATATFAAAAAAAAATLMAASYTYLEIRRLRREYTRIFLPDEQSGLKKTGDEFVKYDALYTLCPDKERLFQKNVTAVVKRVPRKWLRPSADDVTDVIVSGSCPIEKTSKSPASRSTTTMTRSMSDKEIWSRAIFSVPAIRLETFIVGGFKTSGLKLPCDLSPATPSDPPIALLNGLFTVIQPPSEDKGMIASWNIANGLVAFNQRLGAWFGSGFTSRTMSGGRHLLQVRPVSPDPSSSVSSSKSSSSNLREAEEEEEEEEEVELVFACAPDFEKVNRYTGESEQGCSLPKFMNEFHLLYTAYLMDRAIHRLRQSKVMI